MLSPGTQEIGSPDIRGADSSLSSDRADTPCPFSPYSFFNSSAGLVRAALRV